MFKKKEYDLYTNQTLRFRIYKPSGALRITFMMDGCAFWTFKTFNRVQWHFNDNNSQDIIK